MPNLLFSPSSLLWRVNREMLCGLAGPRAVLMQIAHPLVAAGVRRHSSFRKHRLARLYRTSLAAAMITFGTDRLAYRTARSVNLKHNLVHGRLDAPEGPFPAGTAYDANARDLKVWVLATIIDSTLLVYDLFVANLHDGEREGYYADSMVVAELFGLSREDFPPTYAAFRRYMDQMLSGGEVTVTPTARQITDALFSRTPTGFLLYWTSVPGIALLPERLRREFGFSSGPETRARLESAAAFSGTVRRYTPSVLCANPFAVLGEGLAFLGLLEQPGSNAHDPQPAGHHEATR